MKRYLATFAVVVLGTLSSFSSHTRPGYRSQFHVPHATKQAVAAANARTQADAKKPAFAKSHARENKIPARFARAAAHDFSTTTLGFVGATQIPSGGFDDGNGNVGDFNGDGRTDLLSLVRNHAGSDPGVLQGHGCCADLLSLAVVLGNGDGTFKAAVLTTVGNDDPILVGDLNGDGKDDVVQAHPSGTPSSVDVWLSNGDGTFTEGHTYQVSNAQLQGGVLTDVDGDGKLDLLAHVYSRYPRCTSVVGERVRCSFVRHTWPSTTKLPGWSALCWAMAMAPSRLPLPSLCPPQRPPISFLPTSTATGKLISPDSTKVK